MRDPLGPWSIIIFSTGYSTMIGFRVCLPVSLMPPSPVAKLFQARHIEVRHLIHLHDRCVDKYQTPGELSKLVSTVGSIVAISSSCCMMAPSRSNFLHGLWSFSLSGQVLPKHRHRTSPKPTVNLSTTKGSVRVDRLLEKYGRLITELGDDILHSTLNGLLHGRDEGINVYLSLDVTSLPPRLYPSMVKSYFMRSSWPHLCNRIPRL